MGGGFESTAGVVGSDIVRDDVVLGEPWDVQCKAKKVGGGMGRPSSDFGSRWPRESSKIGVTVRRKRDSSGWNRLPEFPKLTPPAPPPHRIERVSSSDAK